MADSVIVEERHEFLSFSKKKKVNSRTCELASTELNITMKIHREKNKNWPLSSKAKRKKKHTKVSACC